MKWLLRDKGTSYPATLPDHIERRLRFALARLGDRIERVIVILQDTNGPKGGIDKECRILATLQGCGAIMATGADSEWTVAVDRATTRIGHTLARTIGRLRDRRIPAHRTSVAGAASSRAR